MAAPCEVDASIGGCDLVGVRWWLHLRWMLAREAEPSLVIEAAGEPVRRPLGNSRRRRRSTGEASAGQSKRRRREAVLNKAAAGALG